MSKKFRHWLPLLLFASTAIYSNAQKKMTGLSPESPFAAASTLPFQAPPFDRIKDSDYQPALEAGIEQQLTEIRKIADNPAPASFENTIVAMEKSGQLLTRVGNVFN